MNPYLIPMDKLEAALRDLYDRYATLTEDERRTRVNLAHAYTDRTGLYYAEHYHA